MSHFRVEMFGGLSVHTHGHALPLAGSCRPILGYLLTRRQRTVSRAELAETLWSDREGEHARHCLSTALWRLKKSTDIGASLLAFHGADDVAFNWAAPAWVDAVAMEWRLTPLLKRRADALTQDDLRRLEHGVRLYRGDYLSGMDQEWACLERQRLRDLYCDGLYRLVMAHAAARDWHQALTWGRRLSREEPLREDVHRLLIQACVQTGNRACALAQYRECARMLAADLGVEPMPETQALYRQLSGTAARIDLAPIEAAASTAFDSACQRLGRVQQLLMVCERQLAQTAASLASLRPPSG
ncbi:MAG: AfsR/SARP family transcriptional regulator [Luteimonas sp.]